LYYCDAHSCHTQLPVLLQGNIGPGKTVVNQLLLGDLRLLLEIRSLPDDLAGIDAYIALTPLVIETDLECIESLLMNFCDHDVLLDYRRILLALAPCTVDSYPMDKHKLVGPSKLTAEDSTHWHILRKDKVVYRRHVSCIVQLQLFGTNVPLKGDSILSPKKNTYSSVLGRCNVSHASIIPQYSNAFLPDRYFFMS
jgi:hypothetical protein